jgi:hypothetical protein
MVIVLGSQADVIGPILNSSEFPSCLEWYIHLCNENSMEVDALNLTYSGNITGYNNNNNNNNSVFGGGKQSLLSCLLILYESLFYV